jgi:hypothetical protein
MCQCWQIGVQKTKDARVWIVCKLLHDLAVNFIAQLAVCESLPKQPTCFFKSRRVGGGCRAFFTISHKSLHGTEGAYSILVQLSREIKQGRGKWAALPGHHLPDGYFPLEDETRAVRRKILLRKFGFDKLLDVRGKVLRQDGVCAARTEAQRRIRRTVS